MQVGQPVLRLVGTEALEECRQLFKVGQLIAVLPVGHRDLEVQVRQTLMEVQDQLLASLGIRRTPEAMGQLVTALRAWQVVLVVVVVVRRALVGTPQEAPAEHQVEVWPRLAQTA